MRPHKLKLNEKQKRLVFFNEFIFNGQNLLLYHWKFSNKNFFRYVNTPFSGHISFLIGMSKRIIVKNVHSFGSTKPLKLP